MAIMTMPRMPAHPMDSTDQGISTTAFFWGWGRGPDGVMAMAGADIALSRAVVETIVAEAELQRVAAAMAVVRQRAQAGRDPLEAVERSTAA